MSRVLVRTGPHTHEWKEDFAPVPCTSCDKKKTSIKAKREIIPGGLLDPIPEVPPASIPKNYHQDPRVKSRHINSFKWLLSQDIPPPQKAEGTGIVMCGGGKKWWGMLVVALRMIRRFSDLPIQVWYRGREEEPLREEVGDLENIEFLDATLYSYRVLSGWETKLQALIHCNLERVLFLDADAYLVSSPDKLLEETSQFVYWEDLHFQKNRVKWDGIGIDAQVGQRIPPIQGGHLLIDRKRFWRSLVITHWMNQHSDYFYQLGYGDQDTWRMVLAATGDEYKCLGKAGWTPPAYVCSLPGGPPLIVHRCRGKLDVDKTSYLPGDSEVFRLYGQWLSTP